MGQWSIKGSVVMGYEREGNYVALIDQHNGYLEIISKQRGNPPRTVGLFEKAHLIQALNKFGEARDAMSLVLGTG